MKLKLSDAPGCFASPTLVARDLPFCRECPFKPACVKFSAVHAAKMSAELGKPLFAYRPPERRAKLGAQPKVAQGSEGLPKKAGALLAALKRQGVDRDRIRSILIADVQVADVEIDAINPEYARAALRLLRAQVARERSSVASERSRVTLNKTTLRDAFERELGWTRGTAQSHVSIVLSALSHIEAIETVAGEIRVKS